MHVHLLVYVKLFFIGFHTFKAAALLIIVINNFSSCDNDFLTCNGCVIDNSYSLPFYVGCHTYNCNSGIKWTMYLQ